MLIVVLALWRKFEDEDEDDDEHETKINFSDRLWVIFGWNGLRCDPL
jgi:hypothetical protein